VALVATLLVAFHPGVAGATGSSRPSGAPGVLLNTWIQGDTSEPSGSHQRFYRLPSLARGDVVSLTASSAGPVFICLVDSVDDENWFRTGCNLTNPSPLSSDGGLYRWTADRAVARPMVRVGGVFGSGAPYRFRVQLQRHLTLTIVRTAEVSATGVITVRTRRSDGTGLPDGHRIGLGIDVNGYRRNTTAPVRGGAARFLLNLPADAAGKRATLTAWNSDTTHYVRAPANGSVDVVK